MIAPFIYGKIVTDKDFTNREKERKILVNNFETGNNTILISPRRWGKSSLVRRTSEDFAKQKSTIRFCFIDMFNIKSEEEFYLEYAKVIIKATSSKTEEILNTCKKYFKILIPKITFNPDINSEFSLVFDLKEIRKNPDEVLNLAERVASDRKIKIIVCIDEFQNISQFTNPLVFQKKLRSNWQKHRNVSYCLYGSKRHLMMEVFSSPSMPFYKFGDILFLQKISREDWIKYITERFRETNKVIAEKEAGQIADLAECHPYYVQQLSQQCWFRTEKKCSEQIVQEAAESMTMQLSLLFQNLSDNLTNTQIHFLKALLQGVDQLSSMETIEEYNLGTSANVLRIKQALIQKEIIDIGNTIEFLDPMFKYWLKKYFFHIIK